MHGLPRTTMLAATVGILGSAWNAGGQATLSLLAVPGLLAPPSSSTDLDGAQALARQWEVVFRRGRVVCPLAAVLAALGYGHVAWQQRWSSSMPSSSSTWSLVGAAALGLAIVPFTLVVMGPTNEALRRAAEGGDVEGRAGLGEGAVRELLGRWGAMNLVRSLLPLASAVLGVWTLVGSGEVGGGER